MQALLLWIGRLAGLVGVIVCAGASFARLSGSWSIGSFQVGTMLQAGTAAMVLGCLAYCASLVERSKT
jgi:hypothetical protein